MNRLTVRQQEVLEALADYHYLVPAQMVRLGLSKSPGAMCRTLRRFAFELPGDGGRMVKNSKAAIGAIRAGVDRESGRIARMYYLTRSGAELVAENRQTDPEHIFYPHGDRLVLADVPHWRLAIDFRIELDRYARERGHTVEFYHQYFRTTGSNRGTEAGERLKKLTRIDFPADLAERYRKPFFWPDGIFVLRAGAKRTLCLVEAYRGSDTGRVMQQLVWHVVALDHGLPFGAVRREDRAPGAGGLRGRGGAGGGAPTADGMGQHPRAPAVHRLLDHRTVAEKFPGLVFRAGRGDYGGRVVLIMRLSGDELRTQRPQVCFRIPPNAYKYRRKSGTKAGP